MFMTKVSESKLRGLASKQAGLIVALGSLEDSLNGSALRDYIAELFLLLIFLVLNLPIFFLCGQR